MLHCACDRAPLHSAACSGTVQTVQSLISHGALLNITNNDGESPLDLAEEMPIRKALLSKWATHVFVALHMDCG